MIISIRDGIAKFLYNENIELDALGEKRITRASYVEPKYDMWYIDFSPIGINEQKEGFRTRSLALEYEKKYIENNIL